METTKTHWRKAFNTNYLSSSDLETETGYKEIVLTIKYVRLEIPKKTKQKEECNIAYFHEAVKPMILNADSCKQVKKFAKSNFIENWNNILVQVYVKKNVEAFGEIVDGLRIRPTQPNIQQQTQVDVTVAILNLTSCETQEDLRTVYSKLSKDEQKHPSVQEIKEKLKAELPQ